MLRWTPLLAVVVASQMLLTPVRAEDIVKPMRDDDVVARVNGTAIYRRAVRDIVQGMLALQDKDPDATTVGKYAADALDSLIELELLYQASQLHGVTVSDEVVNEEIARTRQHFANARAYEQALKEKGITEVALRRDTRQTMAVNRFLEGNVWKDLRISPEQISEFYARNHEEFKHPEQIRASHILIRVPEGASAAERAKAKEKAAALLAQLKAGGDFAQLAKENSQDPGSAQRGGDLGYFAKGDMLDDFERSAFALASGQRSDVVATAYGFHIIQVTDQRAAGYQPLAEVEERIRAVLMKTGRQKRQAELVAQLRTDAKIEYGAPL